MKLKGRSCYILFNLCLNYGMASYFRYGNFKFKQNTHLQQQKKLFCFSSFIDLAVALPYFNLILSVTYTNGNQLKATLQLPVAEYTFMIKWQIF